MSQTFVLQSGQRRLSRRCGAALAVWLSYALVAGCGFAALEAPKADGGNVPAGDEKPGDGSLVGDGNVPASGTDTNARTTPSAQPNVVVGSGAAGAPPVVAVVDNAVREDGPLVAQGSGSLVTVPMTGCPATDYHGRVTVGGSDFDLILDSGSATAAIAGSACSSCGAANRYNVSTGTNLNKRLSASYGSGSWVGQLYSDRVAFGTSSKPASASVTVRFAAMTSQDSMLNGYHCVQNQQRQTDGILGLGPDTLLAAGSTSLLTALTSAGQLANNAFAVQTCDVGGNLLLGGYTAGVVQERPFFVPMVAAPSGGKGSLYGYYYSLSLAGLRLGQNDLGLSKAQLGDTLVDNGTTLVYLPTNAYQQFVAALIANQAIADNFDTGRLESQYAPTLRGLTRAQLDAVLPKLGLTMTQSGGNQVTLLIDATRSYLLPGLDSEGGTQYALAVREGDGDIALILGNTVMRQHLVIFDRANKRIGFATQRGCDDTPSYVGG